MPNFEMLVSKVGLVFFGGGVIRTIHLEIEVLRLATPPSLD